MAKSFLALILNTLGFTAYGWAILENLDNVKAWILFLVGLVFAYYKVQDARATIRGKNLDSKLKEKKLNTIKEKDCESGECD